MEIVGGYKINYSHCMCRVWTLAAFITAHRCGDCGERLRRERWETKEQAQEAFDRWRYGAV